MLETMLNYTWITFVGLCCISVIVPAAVCAALLALGTIAAIIEYISDKISGL